MIRTQVGLSPEPPARLPGPLPVQSHLRPPPGKAGVLPATEQAPRGDSQFAQRGEEDGTPWPLGSVGGCYLVLRESLGNSPCDLLLS